MRVEIVDLRDDVGGGDWSGEDLLDDDWQSDDFESHECASTAPAFVSDDDDDENGENPD